MKAMVLKELCDLNLNPNPLVLEEIPTPKPNNNELLIKVLTCGVCHTELDEIEGRTSPPDFPVILGHQVVGKIDAIGEKASRFKIGDIVGIAWIYNSCGNCRYCNEGNENLCEDFNATGRDSNGGYAEYMVVNEDFAYVIPEVFTPQEAAPLLCAGAIGYRSLRLTGIKNGDTLGLSGFGASAHIVMKMVKFQFPNTKVFVFARSKKEREFSKELGAFWAGDTQDESPEKLDAVIDTTPVWKPIVEALKNLSPNGRLVINAIRKEEFDKDYLLKLDYPTHLWHEKEIKSVANVSRSDVYEFINLAAKINLKPEFKEYALEDANTALIELKKGGIIGAKVLKIS